MGGAARIGVLDTIARPLTLLLAPAGAGKTALLAYWATRASVSPIWLDASRSADRSALRELASGGGGASLVVVDDGQELTREDCELVVEAVRRGSLRAVIASRRDLPLPVVKLELSGQLGLLRADHLRLTDSETRELVRAHAPQADEADVDAVARRANGWAAAVILGARALASAADPATARAAFIATDQPILDYLLDEVFATLPAAARHVLLCTADEERITSESAQVLSGDPTAGSCLAQLSRDGMFVASYDQVGVHGEHAQVWTYHPLLRELLSRQTAIGRPDAALARAAHARAARHFDAAGRPALALEHAIASRDSGLLVELLVRLCPMLLAMGQRDVVARASAAARADLRAHDRALIAVAALERRAAGDSENVLRLVAERPTSEDAPSASRSSTAPLDRLLRADEATVRLWLARTGLGDPRSAVDTVTALLVEEADALDVCRRAALYAELAYACLLTDDLLAASENAQQAAALGRAAGAPLVIAEAVTVAAVVELLSSRFQTAAAEARTALEAMAGVAATTGDGDSDAGVGPPQCLPHAILGWAAWFALELAESRRQLDLARRRMRPAVDPVGAALTLPLAARVLADEGDISLARRLVASDAVLAVVPPIVRFVHAWARAELAFTARDWTAGQASLASMRSAGWTMEACSVEMVAELSAGRRDRVEVLLGEARELMRNTPRQEGHAAIAAGVELVLHLPAPDAPAPTDLAQKVRELLSRCAPQGYLRMLLPALQHPAFLPLLEAEERRGGEAAPLARHARRTLLAWVSPPTPVPMATSAHEAVPPGAVSALPRPSAPASSASLPVTPAAPPGPRQVVTASPVSAAARRSSPSRKAGPPLAPVPALTARELEVLSRLALGEEYVDIAEHLYITQNTVKTHVTALYRKLNVNRRSQALRAAWALGLLGDPKDASPLPGERQGA